MISKVISLYFLFAIVCSRESEKATVTVTVKLGSIRGFKENISNTSVNVFLGVPFAVPPVGDLRFRKPQPLVERWPDILDSTKWPNICMQEKKLFQYYTEPSEDCLYLNIWTPAKLEKDFTENLKSVMVYIHGGGLKLMGTALKHYNALVLSNFGDVVVITINYRLGAFGFLSAGYSDVSGNVGLYDQALALEWIQDNIAYFGGDPTKVTIIGEGAGGWSITMHLLSPLSQNLFNRAIIMSGAIYHGSILVTEEETMESTIGLAKLVGCSAENYEDRVTDAILDCLRRVDANKIIALQSSQELLKKSISVFKQPFSAIVGEAFIPKRPKDAIKEVVNSTVDVMIGNVAMEGYLIHIGMQIFGLSQENDDWESKLRLYIKTSFHDLTDDKMNELILFYFDGIYDKSSEEAKLAYMTALGDLAFNCETVSLSQALSKSHDVYQYLFDYTLENKKDNPIPCDLHKCCHLNDLPLTFGTVSTKNDIKVSKKWMKILTDFAKTGAVMWPKYSVESNPYFEFTGNESNDRIMFNFRRDACKLWNPIFDKHYYSNT